MKVVHIITGLDVGGAERMLAKLVAALAAHSEIHVISLTDEGALGAEIRRSGATVHSLRMSRRGLPGPLLLYRLVRLLRRLRPNVVQTWMYHADLLGGIAARWAGVRAIAWNIRNSDLPNDTKARTRFTVWLSALVSNWIPSAIVCCSENGRLIHVNRGYDAAKFVVIPNGFNLDRFRPDEESRQSVRDELEVPRDTPLVGLIARLDAQKNHALFFAAARKLHTASPGVHYVLAGKGIEYGTPQVARWLVDAGVRGVTHLLGERADIPRLTAALDVATLCSEWGESFPNTLGEALACGVPCVTTDVGDAGLIVDGSGCVIPRGDVDALVSSWRSLLELSPERRRNLGEAARARVAAQFDIAAVAHRYADLYTSLVGGVSSA